MIGTLTPTQNVNTPTILTSAGIALAANSARIGWGIVNLGTNPLYVLMGSGASTSVFHIPLKAASMADDGSGGSVFMEDGVIYTGIITVAGSSPRFTVVEFAP